MDQRLNHLKYQIKGNYESYDSSTEWPILNKINKLDSPAYAGTARAQWKVTHETSKRFLSDSNLPKPQEILQLTEFKGQVFRLPPT